MFNKKQNSIFKVQHTIVTTTIIFKPKFLVKTPSPRDGSQYSFLSPIFSSIYSFHFLIP